MLLSQPSLGLGRAQGLPPGQRQVDPAASVVAGHQGCIAVMPAVGAKEMAGFEVAEQRGNAAAHRSAVAPRAGGKEPPIPAVFTGFNAPVAPVVAKRRGFFDRVLFFSPRFFRRSLLDG